MDVVMLGLPGAGKGTQAERLSSRLRLPWISTGELFREAVREDTDLGERVASILDRGELVPDEIVDSLVRNRLGRGDAAEGFLLDGYPRNVAQADRLDEILDEMDRSLQHVLYLEVPEKEVVRRLSQRLVCDACGKLQPADLVEASSIDGTRCDCGGELVQRPDDRESVVQERLGVFRRQTEPLLDRYRERSLLRRVDGQGEPREVTQRLLRVLGAAEEGAE